MTRDSRLVSLLTVQKRRVDRAVVEVNRCNELLRQRESEREAQFLGWEQADAAYRLQQLRLAEAVTGNLGSGIHATRLTTASLRSEMCRSHLAECALSLAAADEACAAALATASEARSLYRRTLARQDALQTLAASWRRTEVQRTLRIEEQEA